MENRFFVDSAHRSKDALAKKHRLETDPSFRKSHMEYLPGMEQISSDISEKVLTHMNGYDPSAYTQKEGWQCSSVVQQLPGTCGT